MHVPTASIDAYKTTEPWSGFQTFMGLDGEVKKKCATPIISYSNGKLNFDSETEGAVCQSTITDTDITSFSSNEVQLGVTYNISVYATKTGYDNSDVATATLCWIEAEPQKEGFTEENAVAQIKANPLLIQCQANQLHLSGAPAGTPISVFDLSGRLITSRTANEGETRMSVNACGEAAIVKVGERSVKVLLK